MDTLATTWLSDMSDGIKLLLIAAGIMIVAGAWLIFKRRKAHRIDRQSKDRSR